MTGTVAEVVVKLHATERPKLGVHMVFEPAAKEFMYTPRPEKEPPAAGRKRLLQHFFRLRQSVLRGFQLRVAQFRLRGLRVCLIRRQRLL